MSATTDLIKALADLKVQIARIEANAGREPNAVLEPSDAVLIALKVEIAAFEQALAMQKANDPEGWQSDGP